MEQFSFEFKSCSTNYDCDDYDISTKDECILNASVCLYTPRNCIEYGAVVSVNITTNYWPEEMTWKIREDNTNSIKFEGGPYSQAFYQYFSTTCLPAGSYQFNTHGLGGYDYYRVSVGDRIVGEGSSSSNILPLPFLICSSDDQCKSNTCIDGTCRQCSSDDQCIDDIDCTVDTCDNDGMCVNICYPFGPAEEGLCVRSDMSNGWEERFAIAQGVTSDRCIQKCYEYYNNIQDVSFFSSCQFVENNGWCYVFNSPNFIAARGDERPGWTCWIIHQSSPPSGSIQPTSTSLTSFTKQPTLSIQPTQYLASVTLVLPDRSCKQGYSMGNNFKNIQECAAHALNSYWCMNAKSNFIQWSNYGHNESYGVNQCLCCVDTTCPLDLSQFVIDNLFNIYEFRKCSSNPSLSPSTSNSPLLSTSNPSLLSSSKLSSMPSTKPTVSTMSDPTILPTFSSSSLKSSFKPSTISSSKPSLKPSTISSSTPSDLPSGKHSSTLKPSDKPSNESSLAPSFIQSANQTLIPSFNPSSMPSTEPSYMPSSKPSKISSISPSFFTSTIPSDSFDQSVIPSNMPSKAMPFNTSSNIPTIQQTFVPTFKISANTSSILSTKDSFDQSVIPSNMPSKAITFNTSSNIPTIQPTFVPTFKISANPSSIPSTKPSVSTINDPTLLPSFSPSFSCKSDEDRFIFKFNTGKRPWQTEVYIKEKTDPNKKLKWKSIVKLPFEKFKPNDLFTFSTCLKKCTFYRFEIIDRKKNDIGSYEIFYGGEKTSCFYDMLSLFIIFRIRFVVTNYVS